MTAWQGEVTVEAVAPVAPGYFTLRFDQPLIAAAAAPGLFVNVQVPAPELCLRRPISFYAVEGSQVSLMVGVHGRGTAALAAARPGDRLDVMGPLGGRALSIAPEAQRVALVGGGVGVPPLRFLAARCQDGPELVAFIGARERSRLLCLDDFAAFGAEVVASTDDGSAGYHGTAVAALESYLERERVDQILTCGPTPMMRATATLALARGIPCQVCLEARMACALGACLSCVVETTAPGWQKYQRVCTEGPVFDACNVVWGTLSPLCAV